MATGSLKKMIIPFRYLAATSCRFLPIEYKDWSLKASMHCMFDLPESLERQSVHDVLPYQWAYCLTE